MSPAWPVPRRIETERLVIRRYEPDHDVDEYHRLLVRNADRLRPWMPWAEHEPLDRKEHLEWLRLCARWAADGTRGYLALVDKGTDRLVGSAGLHPTSERHVREIGYWLDAGVTGRGLATEAVRALTHNALTAAGATRVEIVTLPGNSPAIAVARRAGFHDEGLTPDTHAGVPMALWSIASSPHAAEPEAVRVWP